MSRYLVMAAVVLLAVLASAAQPHEWDTDSDDPMGGTSVILSNDNSVSQTWEDLQRPDAKVLREAAVKDRAEKRQKRAMEKRHKKVVAETEAMERALHKRRKGNAEEEEKWRVRERLRKERQRLAKHRVAAKERAAALKKELESEEEKREKAEKEKDEVVVLLAGKSRRPSKGFKLLADSKDLDSVYEYTIAFMIKPTGTFHHWTNILARGSYGAKRSPSIFFYPGSTRLHVRSSTKSQWNFGADPKKVLTMHKWHHVAATHDKTGLKVYLDGVLAAFNPGQGPEGDHYTAAPTGCQCADNKNSKDCACCQRGGEQCGGLYKHSCVAKGQTKAHCANTVWLSNPWNQPALCDVKGVRYYGRALTAQEVQQKSK